LCNTGIARRDSGIVVLVADVAKAVGDEYAKTRT
jgi:hypothetical protein